MKILKYLSYILLFNLFFSNSSFANIWEISCQKAKNAMKIVYSHKRKQAIITGINGKKTKVKFVINKSVAGSFESNGQVSGLKTKINFNINNRELSYTQASLRGSNYFMQCKKPVLKKKE